MKYEKPIKPSDKFVIDNHYSVDCVCVIFSGITQFLLGILSHVLSLDQLQARKIFDGS